MLSRNTRTIQQDLWGTLCVCMWVYLSHERKYQLEHYDNGPEIHAFACYSLTVWVMNRIAIDLNHWMKTYNNRENFVDFFRAWKNVWRACFFH